MIKKIITQIKSVNKYGVVAVLVATSLVAFKAKTKQANALWGWNGSSYVQVSGDYSCTGTSGICTREYPAGQNPNSNPNGYLSQENGTFAQ